MYKIRAIVPLYLDSGLFETCYGTLQSSYCSSIANSLGSLKFHSGMPQLGFLVNGMEWYGMT